MLNRQASQLRRSIANAHTLRRLSRPLSRPTAESQTSQSTLLPPSKLSWDDPKVISDSAPSEDQREEFEVKLAQLKLFKRVFAFQASATIYIEIIAVGYACEFGFESPFRIPDLDSGSTAFGIANGFFRVSREA